MRRRGMLLRGMGRGRGFKGGMTRCECEIIFKYDSVMVFYFFWIRGVEVGML